MRRLKQIVFAVRRLAAERADKRRFQRWHRARHTR